MQRVLQYFREARSELGKVEWPNRAQATRLTIVVIVFSLVLAGFIGGVDYVFSLIVQKVILKG